MVPYLKRNETRVYRYRIVHRYEKFRLYRPDETVLTSLRDPITLFILVSCVLQPITMPTSSLRTPTCTCSKYVYDVFISFRGEDTRARFTDHLRKAFKDKGIRVYRDDSDLERGRPIWKELVQAIKTSRIAVIVFSKNYATSKWCLNELVEIMDCESSTSRCKCKYKQTLTVLPIFYDVSPSEVRTQKGNFSNKLPKGSKKKWRKALTESALLSGFSLRPDSSETDFIQQIVENISKTLNRRSLSAAPAGSEIIIHREDSSSITVNIYATPSPPPRKTTKAKKCACVICVIIVLCLLGLTIFIIM